MLLTVAELLPTSLTSRPAGAPLYNPELESMANRGLGAALAQVNTVYAVSHLYRVTRGSVTRVSLHINPILHHLTVFAVDGVQCSSSTVFVCFISGIMTTITFIPGYSCGHEHRRHADVIWH